LTLRNANRKGILARQLGLAEDKRFILLVACIKGSRPAVRYRCSERAGWSPAHSGRRGFGDEVRSEICRLGLSEQVTMLGPLGQTELAQLQRICNVLADQRLRGFTFGSPRSTRLWDASGDDSNR